MNVAGKVALITGGATGLGRATALALARLGCSIALNHVAATKQEAESAKVEMSALNVATLLLEADVTDSDACRTMVSQTVELFGRLDILVNCAGVTRFIPHNALDDVRDEDWDFILGVNVKGTFHCVRACRSAMETHGGVIVNVASIAGFTGSGSSIPYAVSKAGVISLTKSLARVLAPKIRVNAVAPGFIEGRWMREGLGERYAQSRENFGAASPLGRVCQAEDVATAILSLITGSDMVTGHTLVCDGGAMIADPANQAIRTP
jgi:3-oxoacyl-[acyl-carrier protein] reductase